MPPRRKAQSLESILELPTPQSPEPSPERTPSQTINSPEDNRVYRSNEALTFECSDPSWEGMHEGRRLLWRSDVDGDLGVGCRLDGVFLSEGTHLIELLTVLNTGVGTYPEIIEPTEPVAIYVFRP